MFPRESFPELRVVPPPARGLLVYDGECAFCLRAVRLLEGLARRPFDKRPSADAVAGLPRAAARTVAEQVLWIAPDGSIWGGSRALVRALKAAGRPGLAGVLGNPVVRPFTRGVYWLVARMRHRLSRGTHCDLPPRFRS